MGLDVIKKVEHGLGFVNKKKKNNYQSTTDDHLIKYGLIPEFVGRIGNIVELEKLTVEELSKIITESTISPYLQYQQVMETEGIGLDIESDAVKSIAEQCWRSDIGARGIKNYFDRVLRQSIYDIKMLKDKKVAKIIINQQVVDNNQEPIYTY